MPIVNVDTNIQVRIIARLHLNRPIPMEKVEKAVRGAIKTLIENETYQVEDHIYEHVNSIDVPSNTPVDRLGTSRPPVEEGEICLTSMCEEDDDDVSNIEEVKSFELRIRYL